jgi:hypothetical protein
VLLAHLRRIKAANDAVNHNHQLNVAGNDFFAKSQTQIRTAINNMTLAQIRALQAYEAARVAVAGGSTDPKDVALDVAVTRANDNAFNTGHLGGGAE